MIKRLAKIVFWPLMVLGAFIEIIGALMQFPYDWANDNVDITFHRVEE